METLTTNQWGRLMAYTYSDVATNTWDELSSLRYNITLAFLSAQRSAEVRRQRLSSAQQSFEKIPIVAYSALETAINKLDDQVDSLLNNLE